MDYVFAVGGLVILIAGGDVLVRGSVSIALHARVSPMVIGLTIVALGTSAPELVVSIDAAALKDVPQLALGNAIGSNIANVLLVLGIPALIYPMTCSAQTVGRDTIFMIGCTIVFVLLCLNGEIERWVGAILISLLASYLIFAAREARKNPTLIEEELSELENQMRFRPKLGISLLLVAGGLIGLVVGAELLVVGSVNIAREMGVSEATIGLTMVALGTSLPELATSIAAALRRHCDVAIGNVIGSNMFNLMGIIGVTALIVPIPVDREFIDINLWVLLGTALLLIPFGVMRMPITRPVGAALLAAYIGYIAYLL